MTQSATPFTASTLAAGYADGSLTPMDVVRESLRRIHAHGAAPAWIAVADETTLLARAYVLAAVTREDRAILPLFGLPFAVKDNIDVAGLPTTAGCPAFAYMPQRSAAVVERLEEAGAI